MDKRKEYRHLQVASVVMAVLVAASNIALLAGLALEVFDHQGGRGRRNSNAFPASDMVWPIIVSILIVALAVLVALPVRFYARWPVRSLGTMCAGFLIAAGLALAAACTYAMLMSYWLGIGGGSQLEYWPVLVVVVPVLSMFGAAIILITKSRAGEKEAR